MIKKKKSGATRRKPATAKDMKDMIKSDMSKEAGERATKKPKVKPKSISESRGVTLKKKTPTKSMATKKTVKPPKGMTKAESLAYNEDLRNKSDKRLDKRANKKASKQVKAVQKGDTKFKTGNLKAKKVVTADNRKEVVKGSKASGVRVNGKLVSRGKVKASEKAVSTAKKKAIAKIVARAASRAIPYLGQAVLAYDAIELAKGAHKPAGDAAKKASAAQKRRRANIGGKKKSTSKKK